MEPELIMLTLVTMKQYKIIVAVNPRFVCEKDVSKV